MECKMATAILAQGNRLEDSGAILRPIIEDKKAVANMQEAADQVVRSVTNWSRWWCTTVKFLQQIFHSRLWGVTGGHLKKILDRTDLRSARLRRDWSQRVSGLDSSVECVVPNRHMTDQSQRHPTQGRRRRHKSPASMPSTQHAPLP